MNGIEDIGAATPSPAYCNLSGDKASGYAQTLSELKNIADSLSKATENTPLDSHQQTLNSLVKQCEMLDRMMYTAKSWNALMKAYARGKKISMDDNPSIKTVKKIIAELTAALAALEQAKKAEEDEYKENLPLILKLNGGNTDTPAAAGSAATGVSVGAADIASTGGIDVSL